MYLNLLQTHSVAPRESTTLVDKSTDHAKPHSIFFYHNIKDSEINIVLTTENTDSDLKVRVLHYANELLLRVRLSFQKLFQTRLMCRKNMKKCLGDE